MKDMSVYFGVIEDPRHSGYVRHRLEDVLTVVMCAVLCGLDKLDEIVAYQENNQENLKKEYGVTLTQNSIHEKTNEIPVFQEMLEYLNVEGKIVTADATHCQKKMCRKIIEKQGAMCWD